MWGAKALCQPPPPPPSAGCPRFIPDDLDHQRLPAHRDSDGDQRAATRRPCQCCRPCISWVHRLSLIRVHLVKGRPYLRLVLPRQLPLRRRSRPGRPAHLCPQRSRRCREGRAGTCQYLESPGRAKGCVRMGAVWGVGGLCLVAFGCVLPLRGIDFGNTGRKCLPAFICVYPFAGICHYYYYLRVPVYRHS